jgi:hypothetical protein
MSGEGTAILTCSLLIAHRSLLIAIIQLQHGYAA